ncbi:T9SS type A sorting domain-containing protein [Polaribacter litorisediminis]|uniref:T9SS type A sorting domain-containing protein n=1 Tax=Polaribacter litorisediminis TaxID=1908341 RepID=UPI001CBBD4E3|nr:T9SS type A sorting domain-containing protein [Polaribacter litorisediminis]UAM99673.1 T9SS type A sorting domain-containing protein [Polaribacter litorisediminis]
MKKITFLLFTFMSLSLASQTKLTSNLTESYNGASWQNSSRTEYSYDASGNVTEETYLSWDSTSSQWLPLDKSSYTYNADNKATVVLYEYFWGSDSEQNRSNYTYNTNGDLILILDEDWNGSAWVNSYKIDLTYTNNRLSGGTSYEWNGTDWVVSDDNAKITINYNANGTISSFDSDAWDGTNWVSSDSTIFSYDGNNNLILQDGRSWNGTAWISEYKSEYSYDTNGNLITEKESYLENGSFVTRYEQTATFNTAELISSYIHPFKDKTGIDYLTEPNGIINKILTKSGNSSGTTPNRTTYNYGEATASNKDFNSLTFSVYPNPASSFLKVDDSSFSLKSMEIYNLIGQKLLSTTKNQMNIENLVDGVYLLKIESESGKFGTKRIIKN